MSLSFYLDFESYLYIQQYKGKLKNHIKFLNLWMKMLNLVKNKNIFLGYFVLFVWIIVLVEVGLGKKQTNEIKVGVVLDLQTPFSKICLTSINLSLSNFYKHHAHYNTRLVVHVRDSLENVVQASAAGSFLLCLLLVRFIISSTSELRAKLKPDRIFKT